jgi:hypothetical protein
MMIQHRVTFGLACWCDGIDPTAPPHMLAFWWDAMGKRVIFCHRRRAPWPRCATPTSASIAARTTFMTAVWGARGECHAGKLGGRDTSTAFRLRAAHAGDLRVVPCRSAVDGDRQHPPSCRDDHGGQFPGDCVDCHRTAWGRPHLPMPDRFLAGAPSLVRLSSQREVRRHACDVHRLSCQGRPTRWRIRHRLRRLPPRDDLGRLDLRP